MALSDYATRQMELGLIGRNQGSQVVTVIDADGGTMAAEPRYRLEVAAGHRSMGSQLADAIDADGSLASHELHALRYIVGATAALEINTEQGS